MKRTLILVILILHAFSSGAQMNQYFFVRESGTLMDVENYNGAQITNHIVQDDIIQPAKVPMPFTFKLGSLQIDTLGIAENGYLFVSSLSAFAVSSPWPISTQQPSQVEGIISALGIDLHPVSTASQQTTIKSALVGTAPLRTFIIEWKHTSTIDALNEGNPDDINFQIKLYETTGRIEFAYGNFAISPNTSVQAEIGIKGSNFNDYANRSIMSADWSKSIAGTSQMARVPLSSSSKPEYGTLYVWELIPGTALTDVVTPSPLQLYPVPATTRLTVTLDGQQRSVPYAIFDGSGFMVQEGILEGHRALEIGQFAAGTYTLRIQYGHRSLSSTFIKL